ncbi:5'/3'-nucleotidase SurE [Rubrimonas cliftonensis]|uniref:5'-nucleotidase SurE n=1 Tax=Rubrimonas cliftonensis TaxID=89524 RepID=A0A1H3VP61_9RHOB|nr:5'/3'-nucleotidase SurE [Rubrimonas cliftonensis]SDZ76034.1 5'-nucleotidase /3'-nucleotidase /exopolyphosphatase [Rubrimonas cliftonensis]
MRILVTNDDGITAPGLKVAEAIAHDIAGPDGEVWVVAPGDERSGVSHCISYTKPMRLAKLEDRRYAVDGNPADCVILGVHHILAEVKPDLVLSGVNMGHNVAEDAVYSGTIGAAMEGALQGVRAVALSQYYRRGDDAPADAFASARAHGAEAVRRVLGCPWSHDIFYNVNFPAVEGQAVKGFALAPQGRRGSGTFDCVEYVSPSRRTFFWLQHRTANTSAEAGSDAVLGHEGWITVTPMRPDLTAHDLLDGARAALVG